jgi:hypothetical protein
MIFDMNWVNFTPILTVVFYYLEIIAVAVIINGVVNYKNCLRITGNIIINSLKHTFKKN